MKKIYLLCAAVMLIGILQIACSSGNSSDSSSGGTGGIPGGGGSTGGGWVFSISAGVSGNSNFQTIGVTRNMFETSTEHFTVISTSDPVMAHLLRIDKSTGTTSVVSKAGYYISGATRNPDGNLLGVCQTGMDVQPFLGNVTVFSDAGEVLQETDLPAAMVRDMLVTLDDGVVFGVEYLAPPIHIPGLMKVGFDGIQDWELRFTDELDPALPDGMTVTPGAIAAAQLDTDGNIVVAQNIARAPVEGDSNPEKGYAISLVNPQGDLLWSKATYLVQGDVHINAVLQDMVLLPDGTMVIQYVIKVNGVAGPVILDYLDQQGDFIRNVYAFPESEYYGRLALTADGNLAYGTVDYNTDSGNQSTILYKLNLTGSVIWKKTYYEASTTSTTTVPYPRRVYLCDDGGFLVPATSHEISSLPGGGGPEPYEVVFIRTDGDGNQTNNPAFSIPN